MKGVIIRDHGGPETLRVEDLPDPVARAGDVLVEVKATALNHLDIWVRKGVPGHTFPLPLVPGNDVAGVVLETGDGVDRFERGDEVVLAPGVSCGVCEACLSGRDNMCRSYGILGESRDGGCAGKIAVPLANVMPKPANLSFEEAASMPLAFLTAWHMLVDRAKIRPGETVLVHAGGSGVGSAAVQIAKMWGATVIATAGSAAKASRAGELGADHAIDHSKEEWVKSVRSITGKKGVDVVFEHVGEATWEGSLRSLARHGRLVTCGATSGHEVKVDLRHLFFKSISLLGSTMGTKGEVAELLRHAAAGRLKPVVDRVLPMDEVAEAHRLIEERRVFGKVVLVP